MITLPKFIKSRKEVIQVSMSKHKHCYGFVTCVTSYFMPILNLFSDYYASLLEKVHSLENKVSHDPTPFSTQENYQ